MPQGEPRQLVTTRDEIEADKVRLMEIDENLIRVDLTPNERFLFSAERDKVWRGLHGSPKAVGAAAANVKMGRGKKDATAALAVAFTTETAKKTGRAARTIRRDVARGYKLQEIPNITKTIRTSLDRVEESDALINLPKPKQQELIERAAKGEKVSAKVEAKKHVRAEKEEALGAKQQALPEKRYGVILADPAWKFAVRTEAGMDRSADNHYPCQNLEAIKALEVASIAADDCVLFLWATVPMLPEALEVMRAWGFSYKSNYVWVKDSAGTGYWNRNRHEHLLIGTRGALPAPAPGTQLDSVIEASVAEHSAKPEAVLRMIETYFPNLPKIELNRRGPARAGWDAWGNEVEVK